MVEQSSPQAKLYPHRGDADFDEEMWRTAEKFPRKRTAEEGIGGPEGRGAAATPSRRRVSFMLALLCVRLMNAHII